MKAFKDKRTIPIALTLVLVIVIGLGLLGVQLDLFGSAIDSGPATGGNEWLQVPSQGGNDWLEVPVEGSNDWLEVPAQGGNQWSQANNITGYQLLAPDYQASFSVAEITTFNRALGTITLNITLDTAQENQAKWLKDIQSGVVGINYSLLANGSEGQIVTAWIMTGATTTLASAENPYQLAITFQSIQNVNQRG